MKKFILASVLALISVQAYANEQAKAALVRKAVIAGEISPYATDRLKNILRKAHAIDERIAKEQGDVGCEFAEHFYLGHGNGGLEARAIKNWKTKKLPNDGIKVTFNTAYDANLLEFDLVKQGNGYAIDDVRFGYSDNPKRVPKKADDSIKETALGMIQTNGCNFDN